MKRHIIAGLLVVFFTSVSVYGQVGVNTSTPDPSAALDIHSPGPSDQRGALLPRMTSTERNNIAAPATGLMVFDTTDNLFYYFDGTYWNALIPKQKNTGYGNDPSVRGNIVIDSGRVVTPNLTTTNATITTATVTTAAVTTLNVPTFSTNALVPTGGIIMWSGTTPPPGWALCDGGGGRPDLRGRFIVGYDPGSPTGPSVAANDGSTQNYGTPGNTGGETGHLLTGNESGVAAHTHTTNPHNHGYQDNMSTADANRGTLSGGAADANEYDQYRTTYDATVTVNAATAQNAAAVHENRPPYYVLAYIIKLP